MPSRNLGSEGRCRVTTVPAPLQSGSWYPSRLVYLVARNDDRCLRQVDFVESAAAGGGP
jgi:hypothetical protein